MSYLSTTALSKKAGITTSDMFGLLSDKGYVLKNGDKWELTKLGVEAGGAYQESARFGKYIVWPEAFEFKDNALNLKIDAGAKLISSTVIGKHFGLSANKVNFVLSELGWLKKGIKGWLVTEQGQKQQKGVQSENTQSGVPFARWPQAILDSKSLKETIESISGNSIKEHEAAKNSSDTSVEFREKFEAPLRATDGHFVRSKAEMLIDNWLYMAEIVHAYERKLPIEEDVYCDFYIPTGKVYIEYWGYENDPKYLNRKAEKQNLYQKYGFNLIELEEKDVQYLDDILPRLLLKYGVQAY